MGKVVHDDVLDAALTELGTATGLSVNTSEPASRAAAISDNILDAEPAPGFDAIANGDTNGRKRRVQASNGNTAGTTATATHVALFDASVVLYVTTCTSQAITSGNTVNVGLWDVEIADPT